MMPRFSSSQSGFAIRSKTADLELGGYYEINNLGDWSTSASVYEAAIFGSESEAEDAMEDEGLNDGEYEIVHVSRTVQVEIGEGQL